MCRILPQTYKLLLLNMCMHIDSMPLIKHEVLRIIIKGLKILDILMISANFIHCKLYRTQTTALHATYQYMATGNVTNFKFKRNLNIYFSAKYKFS